jgi:hypothetical protein
LLVGKFSCLLGDSKGEKQSINNDNNDTLE